jgi:chitin-binding protein
MINNTYKQLVVGAALMALSSLSFAHGFVDSPGARNYFCGKVTKPDEVANGVAKYPVCGGAFSGAADSNAGYSYMSVLNHHGGRRDLGAITKHVCSFDSEAFKANITPWDVPIDWPVNNINSGAITFAWDISNGPHFSDTNDFRYWITKSGFSYQVGKELTWSDFDSTPFCDLPYDDANPGSYPNISTDKASAHFYTKCTVPSRSGRHVIYAEWGRKASTFERFHGCIDVQIGGGGGGTTSTPASSRPASVASSRPASSRPASVASVPASSRPASVTSSRPASVASSRPASTAAGGTCNWYGWIVPICKNTATGWGNENNQTCVSQATCNTPR